MKYSIFVSLYTILRSVAMQLPECVIVAHNVYLSMIQVVKVSVYTCKYVDWRC